MILAPAASATTRTAEQLNALASLRYQAAQTQVVSAQLSDAKLIAMRSRVAQTEQALAAARSQLGTAQQAARTARALAGDLSARVEKLLAELAAAKDDFTGELARRDATYAADLAVLQLAGEQMLATPEGLRALELYNAGGPGAFAAADAVLAQIEDARAKARSAAAEMQQAEDRRVRARFASDAQGRGLAPLSAAIDRWRAVVALGRPVTRDWVTLSDLYLVAGQFNAARDAATNAEAVASNDFDRMLALGRQGDVQVQTGQSSAAQAAYRAALVLARRRMAAAPADPDAMWSVSALLRKQGWISLESGQTSAARQDFSEALRLDKQRLERGPTLEIRRDIAVNQSLLGDVFSAEGKNAEAMGVAREGLERDRAILAEDPALVLSKSNLATALNSLARFEMGEGRYAAAIALLQEALAMDRAILAADPRNFALADGAADRLSLLIAALDATEARAELAAARAERRALRQRIAEIEPGSVLSKIAVRQMLVEDGHAAAVLGDYVAAESAWAAALAVQAGITAENPAPSNNLDLAGLHESVATGLEMQEKFAGAEKQYRAALALITPLAKADSAVWVRQTWAGISSNLADLLAKTKRPAEGISFASDAVGVWRGIAAADGGRQAKEELVNAMGVLATLQQQSGQEVSALQLRRDVLTMCRELLVGSETPRLDRNQLARALLTGAKTATLAKAVDTAQAWYREGTDVLRELGPERTLGALDQFVFSLRNYAAAPGTPPGLAERLLAEAAQAETKREAVFRLTKDTP